MNIRVAAFFVALIALIPLGACEQTVSTITNVDENVGPYNVTFNVPGVRDFYYEIADPRSFSGSGEYAGTTGTVYDLTAKDRHTDERLMVKIARYDTPVARAMTQSFTNMRTPDWVAHNPFYGTIWIYYNIISGYSVYVTIDEYTMITLNSDMSQNAIGKIAETLRVETE
jgi:hypothetical protein